MKKSLQQKLAQLPSTPGIYFHKNNRGEIIYVGKAAILKNRVRQYFQKSRLHDPKTDLLVSEITDTDWLELDSEAEALFLEAEMVKRYMPKYNILLRDDKSNSFIRIDIKSKTPSVTITRRPLDDQAEYFGPFLAAGPLRKALNILRKVFPYSTHTTLPSRACLQYHLGLCPGPETAGYDRAQYVKDLKNLILYIKGNKNKLIRTIESDMKLASKQQNYEQAAILRNRLRNLKSIQTQVIFGDSETVDLSKDHALFDTYQLFSLKSPPRHIAAFDISHLQGTNVVASEVVFSNGAADKKNYRKYKMHTSGNDDFLHMHEVVSRSLKSIKKNNKFTPNLMLIDGGKGQLSFAIRACEENNYSIPIIGITKKYEEIIIHKTKSNIILNDSYIKKLEGKKAIDSVDYIKILLPQNSHIIKLLQRVRDESHRFAVSYHSHLKLKQQTHSVLDDIPGIGPKSKKRLLSEFGSLKSIKEANKDKIAKLIGNKKANILAKYLN
jgi:excinuclease ABC subunit C